MEHVAECRTSHHRSDAVYDGDGMRVLVCGSRNWHNKEVMYRELDALLASGDLSATPSKYDSTCLIHGACRGADLMAAKWAELHGVRTLAFPADWHKYGRAAGPVRNQKMLDDAMPELVIAFHEDIEQSKGTKDMLARAGRAKVTTWLVSV